VEVTTALEQLGGIASRKELMGLVSRAEIERALASGAVVRPARGRYALPTQHAAREAAQRLTGTVVLVSAATHWQWRRMWEPKQPQVAVPVGRKVPHGRRAGVDLRWRTIAADDVVDGWVTGRVRTVLDCAVLLPFPQALAIADSALRSRTVTRDELLARVGSLGVQLRPRVRRLLEAADERAANPFESALRAILLDVPGLGVEPQVRIDDEAGFVGRVDLADRRLRIVVEGESFEFHGEKEMLDRDCRRYSRLSADGWLVLRFSWTQVMARPDWVRALVQSAVDSRLAGCPACRATAGL
jgi:very-short-patch-repair endonuclease